MTANGKIYQLKNKIGDNKMLELLNSEILPSMQNDIKVLVVDDDQGMREVLKEYLNRTGCWVQGAKDGIEAIEKLEKENYSYEIVLTDLNMPKCSGLDVMKAAKKNNPDSHVIIITAYGTLETAIEAIRLGAYDYITKPFKMEEIGILMENLLKKLYLIRENKMLLKRLRDAYTEMAELRDSKRRWEDMLCKVNEGIDACEREFTEDLKNVIPKNANSYLANNFADIDSPKIEGKFIRELEKLAELKSKGILTEEEFIVSKKVLLKGF
ncbi:MAG: hypothetical protein A2161_08125 [Candidatus Schekmanbacteria bacterium RBG_13_48_7]|uniref:Response regulatory domain-containing protein n=1 Tax=Candidatus Schekmanbacteria bacterium RBG_13_48_7 TaxID=1817878 RepID=A0A1F7RID4_9BACT|nr:MAG: hypothetical protein A2161_08125 [Candidatus Schekmanbacteria bacterium RBG_13_48_7]